MITGNLYNPNSFSFNNFFNNTTLWLNSSSYSARPHRPYSPFNRSPFYDLTSQRPLFSPLVRDQIKQINPEFSPIQRPVSLPSATTQRQPKQSYLQQLTQLTPETTQRLPQQPSPQQPTQPASSGQTEQLNPEVTQSPIQQASRQQPTQFRSEKPFQLQQSTLENTTGTNTPRVAIIDFGFEKEQGHGRLIREVFESQLGKDGKQVHISTFGDSNASGENGNVTIQQLIGGLKQAVDKSESSSPYNYVNLSWGSDKLQPQHLIDSYTRSLGDEITSIQNTKPEDLTAQQKQDLVNYAIQYSQKHSKASEPNPEIDQDLVNLGQIYDNVLKLMRSGSQIYHAAPNTKDIYDAVSLLDGFNDKDDARFYTVGRYQGSIFDSSKNLTTIGETPDNTILGSRKGVDIWAADQLRPGVEGSSFSTAEAIVNHLVKSGKAQLIG